jgi:gamma-glutamyltranspeptidase/glutathione hydrolase
VCTLLVLGGFAAMTLAPEAAPPRSAQGRSVVMTRGGIVAAESPLAAQAGAQVLVRGGSAVDAAIAANAVMGVVSPMMNGIGGDLFAIVYDAKTGKRLGLNASGWAPRALTPEFLRAQGYEKMPGNGIHTVTVPGCVEGWVKLHERLGRRPWADDFDAAIRIAEEGALVTEWVSQYWQEGAATVAGDPAAHNLFLPGGRAPHAGEIFRNLELAASLRAIAECGRDAFYSGPIAKRILTTETHYGGTMSAEDLAEFSAEWVEPISTTYRGWTVYEMPPNGQGIAALILLNIAENFALSEMEHNSADALHVLIEAKKLAYADMLRYVADPHFATVPVAGLLSKDYARQRAAQIDLKKASSLVSAGMPPAGDTTYLAAVDRDGNMVSLIQSIYERFGSGIAVQGAGFTLQNRGAFLNLDAASPNVLAGRKRPLHTIIPAHMEKGNQRIAFGIMGAWNQAQAHAQFAANVVDFGMNIQAALESPRFTKHTFEGCDVEIEDRVPASVRAQLESRGHMIQARPGYSQSMGGGQAVMRDYATGVSYGASDPRKDGAAIPEPEP